MKEKIKKIDSGYYEVYGKYGELKATIKKLNKPIFGKSWEITTHSYVQHCNTKHECLEMIGYYK